HSDQRLSAWCFLSYTTYRELHSFPTRRSSDLRIAALLVRGERRLGPERALVHRFADERVPQIGDGLSCRGHRQPRSPSGRSPRRDRKSTRLNSSHLGISYAVFCLKKNSDRGHI